MIKEMKLIHLKSVKPTFAFIAGQKPSELKMMLKENEKIQKLISLSDSMILKMEKIESKIEQIRKEINDLNKKNDSLINKTYELLNSHYIDRNKFIKQAFTISKLKQLLNSYEARLKSISKN